MKAEVHPDAASAAGAAARLIADAARAAIEARGRFIVAFSGGRSPWIMLRELAKVRLDWKNITIAQVDERVAPAGHADRNLTHLLESLKEASLPRGQILEMPVEAFDLEAAAGQYELTLRQFMGSPTIFDLIHLGLGPDGHTASLVPGDPVLDVIDTDVATTGLYQGLRRMTLTYPILNRARSILWLVTGKDKAAVLPRLCRGDPAIPAGRVRQDQATLLADAEAADFSQSNRLGTNP